MEREQSLSVDKVKEWMEPQFDQNEVTAGLKRMEEDGVVMIAEGMTFLI